MRPRTKTLQPRVSIKNQTWERSHRGPFIFCWATSWMHELAHVKPSKELPSQLTDSWKIVNHAVVSCQVLGWLVTWLKITEHSLILNISLLFHLTGLNYCFPTSQVFQNNNISASLTVIYLWVIPWFTHSLSRSFIFPFKRHLLSIC